MANHQPREGNSLVELARMAEGMLASADADLGPPQARAIRSTLAAIEAGTPGGAPLHAQLDNVRKWLDALERPADHERFGGVGHIRDYVITQLRLALGALDDYRREMK